MNNFSLEYRFFFWIKIYKFGEKLMYVVNV